MTLTTEEPVGLPAWLEDVELDLPPPAPPSPADVEPNENPSRTARAHRPAAPPLSPRLELARLIFVVVFAVAAGMVIQLTFVSSLQQRADQQRLYDSFRARLAEGTAPVGPVDPDGALYPPGTPVAYLEIPDIDLRQVVVSGTASGTLFAGPGHRRDTVLPGQAGASIIMGRRAAYGGPFGTISKLDEGDAITVTTGQGEFEYRVLGVRHEGDPLPPPPQQGESRLILTTAAGTPYLPDGVLRVDAQMEGTASASPGRLFPNDGLPAAEDNMAGDTSQLWALVLWLQALIVVALGAAWSWHRWGRAQAWAVFLPPLLLVGIFVSGQAARLLPNLL